MDDNFFETLSQIENLTVQEAILKASTVIDRHNRIFASVSGGSDSDIVIDILERIKKAKNIKYVFFDTGLEYEATKKHLVYLNEKYGIEIEKIKAQKSIPICVKEYGVPFLSKQVSENIERLQRHGFKFEDKPYDDLIKEYPHCASALKWWCNIKNGNEDSHFNISRNKFLKEFMVENPPTFKISSKCCYYAKKVPSFNFEKTFKPDLKIIGVRKSEGGVRATAYSSCYSENLVTAQFRPIFWFNNSDKKYYEDFFRIVHSDCYLKYGLIRTGCVGCPFGKNCFAELESVQLYEPKLYKACINIFGESYEYTRRYRAFCEKMKAQENEFENQVLFEEAYV